MGGIGSKLEEIQEFEEAQQEMEKQEVTYTFLFASSIQSFFIIVQLFRLYVTAELDL